MVRILGNYSLAGRQEMVDETSVKLPAGWKVMECAEFFLRNCLLAGRSWSMEKASEELPAGWKTMECGGDSGGAACWLEGKVGWRRLLGNCLLAARLGRF